MLGYHRKFLLEAKTGLNEIKSDPDKLDLLFDLQLNLVLKTLHIEKQIKRLKKDIKSLRSELRSQRFPKDISQKKKQEISRKNKRIDDYKWFIFILKSFGDSLAHIYLDTLSIKQLLYNTDSYKAKEDAGFLLGKEGLAYELALLREAINHGVPAVLCDITNSLRHGDICLLGANDPALIEVKASKDTSKRAKRQIDAIEKLHSFYEDDYSNELHAGMAKKYEEWTKREGFDKAIGLTQTHRQTVPQIRFHTALFNKALSRLKDGQTKVLYPEEGVRYLIARNDCDDKKIKEFCEGFKSVYPFSWNDAKNNKDWHSYIPFTLSIEKPRDLYDFLSGDLNIMIFIDLDRTLDALSSKGLSVSIVESIEGYIFKCKNKTNGAVFMISQHLFHRVGSELLYLEDFVSASTSIPLFMTTNV